MNLDPAVGIADLAAAIRANWPEGCGELLIVGIRTGGLWVAQHLCRALDLAQPHSLDISYHRDDLEHRGMNPHARASELPLNIDDREVLLVDDVLHTGRTVRAALNVLFDYGRPRAVRLAVLVDRGGRELPVAAEFVAFHEQLAPGARLKVDGPDPLIMTVLES